MALEDFLHRTKAKNKPKLVEQSAFAVFSGILSKEEAEEVKRAIEEGCETIHPDDWK